MVTNSARMPDQASPVHRLAIKPLFDNLTPRDKLYAHHLSKAAWAGTRIILRQTSSESEAIFDFIIALYHACNGNWGLLIKECEVSETEVKAFLSYAGLFLYNIGNFYGEGGQKFVPNLCKESLRKIVRYAGIAGSVAESLIEGLSAIPPHGLGYPSDTVVSNYYPGDRISREEIAEVQLVLQENGIEPENTRVRKTTENGTTAYEVLQASSETGSRDLKTAGRLGGSPVRVEKGDHQAEMYAICEHLDRAAIYTQNMDQMITLAYYTHSFQTGNLAAYLAGQRTWVKDVSPRIEHILGFVETYRDPHGARAEWEGVVCITDPEETKKMAAFAASAAKFCTLLPWATAENEGKGPFEKSVVEIPDFAIVHALTVCCPYVWEASNLPNYNDIREEYGSKNTLLTNRMSTNCTSRGASPNLLPEDTEPYRSNLHTIRFVATAIHELLGHGTGKLFRETSPGNFNFDATHPPLNPLTGHKIASWYLARQTYFSAFGDIAQSVEECRAILISAYLIENKALLELFGFNDHSTLTAEDVIYLSYLHLGIKGLRSLEHYNPGDRAWSQAHSQGYFAIFKHLLHGGNGVLTVQWDAETSRLAVKVDRGRILDDGKPALGRMMCCLHVWRCTADAKACRAFYEPLTAVEGVYEEWRRVVVSTPEPRWKFVQANTFLVEGKVEVKE